MILKPLASKIVNRNTFEKIRLKRFSMIFYKPTDFGLIKEKYADANAFTIYMKTFM